jgi:hypothetical protein
VNVTVENIDVGDVAVIEVTVPSDATGWVHVTVDNVTYAVKVTDGKASIEVPGLASGEHDINVTYLGDDKYLPSGNETAVEVSKVPSTVVVSVENITGGDKAVIEITVPSDATGNVTVTVDGKDYNVPVAGGKGILVVPDLEVDNYTVTAKYLGDDKYEPSEGSAEFSVNKAVSNIQVIDHGNGTVVVVVPENATGSVTINVDGKEFTADVVDGIAEVNLDNVTPGEHVANVTYSGDGSHEGASVNVNVTAPKYETPMDVKAVDINVGDTEVISVTIPDDATGNVTVEIDGIKQIVEVHDGVITITIDNLTAGNKTAIVSYSGDDNYSPNSTTVDFTVFKADPSMTISVDSIVVGEDAVITVTVPDDATGHILVEVGGIKSYGEIENGKAVITISGLAKGNYTVTATYDGDDKYNGVENTTSLEVSLDDNYNMTVNATSEDGKAIVEVTLPDDATGTVTVTDKDGNKYTAPVENGKATVEVPGLPVGENELDVSYSGDDKYNPKETTTSVNVTKKDTILSGDKLEMYMGDGSNFTVTLTDTAGNPIANRGIKVNITGKTYTIITDANGVAKLPINLKGGSHPVYAWFNGDSSYNPSNNLSTTVEVYVTPRIIENNDLVKDYGGNEKFTVRALDKYGKPVGAYAKVKMTVCGKTYTVCTDANGYASLPINLKPGNHVITCEYGGTTVSNLITVNNVVYPDSSFKKLSTGKYSYSATLKASNGKLLSGKDVSIIIKGTTYNLKTDKYGVVTVKDLALNAGTVYTVKVTYLEYTAVNTIKA